MLAMSLELFLSVINSRLAKKTSYVVDLRSQQAECEANYVRLCKLLPSLEQREHWEYHLAAKDEQPPEKIQLKVLERAPYTFTIEIKQAEASHAFEPSRVMRVRMYHDARMAEVVSWNRQWNIRSRYDYPNRRMCQKDEKYQLNSFLGEWLAHCLARGRVVQPISN